MSVRKNVFRYGDRVRIVNPLIFIRCGYPWSKQYVKDNIINEQQKQSIWTLIENCIGRDISPMGVQFLFLKEDKKKDKTYEAILDALAYEVLCQNLFGGRERTIHTELREDLRDKNAYIRDRRVVKTGRHVAGSRSYDYYNGYEDYDPPMLGHEKTHVIHSLDIAEPSDIIGDRSKEIWIEKIHLEKVTEPVYEEAEML